MNMRENTSHVHTLVVRQNLAWCFGDGITVSNYPYTTHAHHTLTGSRLMVSFTVAGTGDGIKLLSAFVSSHILLELQRKLLEMETKTATKTGAKCDVTR